MQTPAPTRVLLLAEASHVQASTRLLLARQGWAVSERSLSDSEVNGLRSLQLILIDSSGKPAVAVECCRRIHRQVEGTNIPVLMILDDAQPATRLSCLVAGADAYIMRPFLEEELVAQSRALMRLRELQERLAERTTEVHRVNKRLQVAYQQIDQELQLAQRLQSSFLPQSLPEVADCKFAVHHLVCGRVGGDFYDVFRLDEHHVGLYVADAMGHGVPASLLTLFIKKAMRPKEVFDHQYRLVPPDEVLFRLNRDLVDQQLPDQPFLTLAYALLNHCDGTLQFSRAGHPHPLYIPRHGEPRELRQEGLLLGVADAKYDCRHYQLAQGDKLILYTDGLNPGRLESLEPGLPSILECCRRYRDLPIQEMILAMVKDLFGAEPQPDDLTLLGLQRGD